MSKGFGAIEASLALKNEVTAISADADVEVESTSQPRGFRINSAGAVRDTVLEKWLEGIHFTKSDADPNCFLFVGHNEAGNSYKIRLLTPYRETIGVDDRLPFALDVWMDERKQLNFEWDTDGNYALRGFKRGDWIEDLQSWNIRGARRQSRRRAA